MYMHEIFLLKSEIFLDYNQFDVIFVNLECT